MGFWSLWNERNINIWAYLLALVALGLPQLWPDVLLKDLPLVKTIGDNPEEEFSVALFQYVSLVYVALIFVTTLHLLRSPMGVMAKRHTGPDRYHRAITWLIPLHTIVRVISATLLASFAVAFYDNHQGEGIAIPLFFFETLPLALMVTLTGLACRAGVVAPVTVGMVAATLFLIPLQFVLDGLFLPLIFGSFPAMFAWAYVILRKLVLANDGAQPLQG